MSNIFSFFFKCKELYNNKEYVQYTEVIQKEMHSTCLSDLRDTHNVILGVTLNAMHLFVYTKTPQGTFLIYNIFYQNRRKAERDSG